MAAIELRDYVSVRPELVPSFEALRALMRPGEVAMVTETLDAWIGAAPFRVWLRDGMGGRTFGKPAPTLAAAIANLIAKLARAGRVPR